MILMCHRHLHQVTMTPTSLKGGTSLGMRCMRQISSGSSPMARLEYSRNPQHYVSTKGHVCTRTILKDKMYFHPPPVPLTLKGKFVAINAFLFCDAGTFLEACGSAEDKNQVPQSYMPCPTRQLPDQGWICTCSQAGVWEQQFLHTPD